MHNIYGKLNVATRRSAKDRRKGRKGVPVRVVEYRFEGIPDAEDIYRLITTVLDPDRAPAKELAALYHDRWEIETPFGELKTHLRGARRFMTWFLTSCSRILSYRAAAEKSPEGLNAR